MQSVREDQKSLSIGGRFKGYGPEDEKAVRKAHITEDKVLGPLSKAFQEFMKPNTLSHVFRVPEVEDLYDHSTEIVKDLEYNAEAVERFSAYLEVFQYLSGFSVKAGVFISALINNGEEDNLIIRTNHNDVMPDWLGFINNKNVVVIGDVGKHLGVAMEKGTILVKGNAGAEVGSDGDGGLKGGAIVIEGNAGDYAGACIEDGSITILGNVGDNVGYAMSGGEIIVKGNAGNGFGAGLHGGVIVAGGNVGDYAGCDGEGFVLMEGGTILIHGNAGRDIGDGMEGGEIRIEGDYESLGKVRGGKIFRKGKPIVGAPE